MIFACPAHFHPNFYFFSSCLGKGETRLNYQLLLGEMNLLSSPHPPLPHECTFIFGEEHRSYLREHQISSLGEKNNYFVSNTLFYLFMFQMCDSLELLLLSVLAPTIHCLWHLSSWEEAFITTVSV